MKGATTYIEGKAGSVYCAKSAVAELIKSVTGEDEAGPLVLLVSTEAVDSDGDVIHQRPNKNGPGWVVTRFNGAPVISWQHDLRIPNLSGPETQAKVRKHATKGQGLHLDPLTFDVGDPFALSIEGKLRRDVIKESSVGFKVLNRGPRKVDGQTVGFDIWGAELFEVAIANRGANPETEVLAKHLLALPAVARDVEDAGNPEALELRAEIEHLAQEVVLLTRSLKVLSDRVDGEDEARALAVREKRDKNTAAVNAAASELLKVLRAEGTAHGS